MMATRQLLGSIIAGLLIAGCSSLTPPLPPAPPTPCLATFSAARCAIILDRAALIVGVEPDEIAAIDVLPDPTPQVIDGSGILQVRSGPPPLVVRVTLADGAASEVVIGCGGISSATDPACMDDPKLRVSSVTISGYGDVPCQTEDPSSCATPVAPPDPEARAQAEPIVVPHLVVPIDRSGLIEVKVGEGSLPNGILTTASFRFVDDWPAGVFIPEAYVLLDVRSLEPDGRPFDNVHLHGRREGVERVEAVLVFEVARFDPGAVISFADIIVE